MAHVEFQVQYPSGAARKCMTERAAFNEANRYGGRVVPVLMRDVNDTDMVKFVEARKAFDADHHITLHRAPADSPSTGTGIPTLNPLPPPTS